MPMLHPWFAIQSGNATMIPMVWRAILLLYSELDVKINVGRLRKRRFHHLASQTEISDACESFGGLPKLIADLTSGLASMTSDIITVDRPLTSLKRESHDRCWPSPDDTRQELDRLAPAGRYDSIFVFWPAHDFEAQQSVPYDAWGLALGASDWSNGATYAAVASAPTSAWQGEARGEVWLHEWLHGVCHHFAQQGYDLPERDADGAELHGYTRSPTAGWTEYYRDLMSGNVRVGKKQLGIPLAAWKGKSLSHLA